MGGDGRRSGCDEVRQLDVSERPAVAVPLVVGNQRAVHRAVRRGLKAAIDGRRDLEARLVGHGPETPDHFGANHLGDIRRMELRLGAEALADDRLGERRLVLGVVDRAGLAHPPQHVAAPRGRPLGARDRVQSRRPLRDTRENRDLGDRELAQVLTEVGTRGRRHAVRALTEEVGVEIELEDLLLRELALDPEREDDLPELLHEALHAGLQGPRA